MTLYDVSLELLLNDLRYARDKASRLGFADVVEAIECAIMRLSLAIDHDASDTSKEASADECCLFPQRLPPAR